MLNRDVAFALLKDERLGKESRTRLTREAKAMEQLSSHPHIVTIYDLGEQEGQPYIVTELMHGGDLRELIEKAPEHQLPFEQIINITKFICLGLESTHTRDIIHRALKPSNIYLSAEATAKIGDFGLAIMIDSSRVIKSSTTLGTASYMPPEQAREGKITHKNDLYSLGVILYEMITGRPPFIGDNPEAIIRQHLNVPAIPPRLYRLDLPLDLEDIIMRLLEKDPKKRPESAAHVWQLLVSFESRSTDWELIPEVTASTRSRIYRKIFVGRETEKKQLEAAFESAVSGEGSLVMLEGEPGIGKTALCEQIATYAAQRGGSVLTGHCYEEKSLSLPYMPFVEILQSYVLTRETDQLKIELGTRAADLARIVPGIRDRLQIRPGEVENPVEDSYRLMQAVVSYLRETALIQPLLLILEDLHEAEKGTLEMLTEISRNLADARILIVCTCRDTPTDQTPILSETRNRLQRLHGYERIRLTRLDGNDVKHLINAMTGHVAPERLASTVHYKTDGIPLFVQELVRYLVDNRFISLENEAWQLLDPTVLAASIPKSLRGMVDKRLSLLSEECRQILTIAAVIGQEFPVPALQRVAEAEGDDLFSALEEAQWSGVIDEYLVAGAIVSYRFAHAFFRQSLYEGIIAPRRTLLHQQVAEILEDIYARNQEEHAGELAEHFSHSSNPHGLAKAIAYGDVAAQRACAVFAYGDAANVLERVVKVQRLAEPENKTKRCDLLIDLCDYLIMAGEPQRVLDETAPAALLLAETLDDSVRVSRVCHHAMSALSNSGAELSSPEAYEWNKSTVRHAQRNPDIVAKAEADVRLGMYEYGKGNGKEGYVLLERAFKRARRIRSINPEAYWLIMNCWIFSVAAPQRSRKRLLLAKRLMEEPREGVSERTLVTALIHICHAFLGYGRRDLVERLMDEIKDFDWLPAIPNLKVRWENLKATIATIDGRLEDALRISEEIKEYGQESGIPEFARVFAEYCGGRPKIYLGGDEGVLKRAAGSPASPPTESTTDISTSDPLAPFYFAYLSRNVEAIKALDELVLHRLAHSSAGDETEAWCDVLLLEAAVFVGHRQATGYLFERLADSTVSTTESHYITCAARHLGAAARFLGRPDEALSYLKRALKVATRMAFRPEIALTRLQLAELLMEYRPEEDTKALRHLELAINALREMNMRPWLDIALQLRRKSSSSLTKG